MLTDIFSSFDPATSSFYTSLPSPIFWIMNLFILIIISSFLWITPSRLSFLLSLPKNTMYLQVSRTTGHQLKGFSSLISSAFLIIIIMNLTGLLPYIFSISSHLFFTMAIAIPLWLSLIISSFINSQTSFLASILPGGAPDWLNPFLVLVETISILVRPITLSFRLAANMSAGHIVLGLIGIYAASALFLSTTNTLSLLFIQTIYIMFEMGICLIQAYIFCLLLSLYADDHTT